MLLFYVVDGVLLCDC